MSQTNQHLQFIEDTLPNKLSDLMLLALKDLEAIMQNPRYELDMVTWHSPYKKKGKLVCKVCLAGAVMANTLKYDFRKIVTDSTCSENNKLCAIDCFRAGHVYSAFNHFYNKSGLENAIQTLGTIENDWDLVDIKDYPKIKPKMLKAIKQIQKAGY